MTTRDDILEAALACFGKHGYDGTGMRDIATRAGIRAASIYNHFAGKREIFLALIDRMGPGRLSRALRALPDGVGGEDQLDHVLSALFAMWRDEHDRDFMRIFCAEALFDPSVAQLLHRHLFGIERDELKRLLEAAGVKSAHSMADLCIAIGFGKRLQILLSPMGEEDLERVCEETEAQFRQLLSQAKETT